MKKITNKEKKILSMLNSFGYLGNDFFRILFHVNSNLCESKLNYKVRKSMDNLILLKYVSYVTSGSGIYYILLPLGKTYLYNSSHVVYSNNERLDSGKFFHSRYCSLVLASLYSRYKVDYKTEKNLNRSGMLKIVPDLAVRINETVLYFEIERSLKSQELIKEKLVNYNTYFGGGYLIYLTGNRSIINKINKLKVLYKNTHKVFACDIMDFINNPEAYIESWNMGETNVAN